MVIGISSGDDGAPLGIGDARVGAIGAPLVAIVMIDVEGSKVIVFVKKEGGRFEIQILKSLNPQQVLVRVVFNAD